MSRFPRSPRPFEPRGPAINDRIRARQVLLIDENNEKVGVVETIEALRRAHAAGLDLVEVSSEATPPVCRILDFGKYKYEQAKKDKASKAKSKPSEVKEVRLGRSMKIDPHDVGIRVDQARRFLMEGHKVLIVQNFRGRELMHKHLGDQRMKDIVARLSDVAKLEIAPRLNGRRMAMMLTPDKGKIEAMLRKGGGAAAKPDHADDNAAHPADEGQTAPDGALKPAAIKPDISSPAKPSEDAPPEPARKPERRPRAAGASAGKS